jgi:hypothetical protein
MDVSRRKRGCLFLLVSEAWLQTNVQWSALVRAAN